MQGSIIAIAALVLSGSALVAFLLLRRYASQRSADVGAQIKGIERLHGEMLDGQARHHEHIERVVLSALAHFHDQLGRTIRDGLGVGLDAHLAQLDELLSSRTKELRAQVQDLLRTQADEQSQAAAGLRSTIKDELQTGIRGTTQQVDDLRREFTDLLQRVAPASVELSTHMVQSDRSMHHASQLVFGAEESPLVRITALALANERAASSIHVPVTDSIRREVGPTLGHAARALLGGAQTAQRQLKMVFSPEIAQGLQDGTLHMMKSNAVDGGIRAMALDASGTIRGQASLVKGLNPASVAMGALQIMAVITAQQYLAVINRQLEQIQGGINSIRDWLTNEVRGRVRGNSDQLDRMAQALNRHEVSERDREVFAHELQTIDREMTQVLRQIEEERRRAFDAFRHRAVEENAFKADGLLGDSLTTVREKLVRELEPCRNTSELAILATRVRAMSVVLRGALGLNQHHALDLADELFRDHDAALEQFREWRQALEAEIGALKSRYRTATTDREARASLHKALEESFASVDTNGGELRGVLRSVAATLQQQIAATARPTELEVTIDADGRIAELRHAS